MNGKFEKRYMNICVIVSCVMFTLLIMANAKGIFAENASAEADRSDGEYVQEIMEQTSQNHDHFWRRDTRLPAGVMQITLPFAVAEDDVAVGIDVPGGNVMKIEIFGEGKNHFDGSLAAYLQKEPVVENLSEEEAVLHLAETDEKLIIYYESQQLYDGEIAITHSAEDERNILQVAMKPVREKYDRIVVLDAGHGGDDAGICCDGLTEKDLTLAVAAKSAALLKQEGIQVYSTRTADENVTQENRAALANLLHADMLISIHAAQDEDSSIYGMRTTYNDTFFIPDFSGADLGYILLEKVAGRTNDKALGMEAEAKESVVLGAEVPVALLEIGYLSNAQERRLLEKEDYLDKIAQGIVDAVIQSYEEMKQ